MKRLNLLVTVAVIQIAVLTGCKTNPNPNDQTPPTFEWTVVNKTDDNKKTTLQGSGSVTCRIGDHLDITACVIDDGGITEISSSYNAGYSCTKGDLGQSVGPGLSVKEVTPLGLDKEGKAWARFCRVYSTDANFTCSSGFNFAGGTYQYYLSGKNYANLTANATLTVNVASR